MPHGLLRQSRGFWDMEEETATTTIADRTQYGHTLAQESTTVAQGSGKIGFGQDYERSSGGGHGHLLTSGNTELATEDIEYFLAAWVKVESFPSDRMSIMVRRGAERSDYCLLNDSAKKFALEAAKSTGGSTTVTDPTVRATGTWYFVVAWHDRAANKILIQVDGGAVTEASLGGATVKASTSSPKFGIGTQWTENSWDGVLDSVTMMRRMPTEHERRALYNNGAGRNYKSCMRPYRRRQMG